MRIWGLILALGLGLPAWADDNFLDSVRLLSENGKQEAPKFQGQTPFVLVIGLSKNGFYTFGNGFQIRRTAEEGWLVTSSHLLQRGRAAGAREFHAVYVDANGKQRTAAIDTTNPVFMGKQPDIATAKETAMDAAIVRIPGKAAQDLGVLDFSKSPSAKETEYRVWAYKHIETEEGFEARFHTVQCARSEGVPSVFFRVFDKRNNLTWPWSIQLHAGRGLAQDERTNLYMYGDAPCELPKGLSGGLVTQGDVPVGTLHTSFEVRDLALPSRWVRVQESVLSSIETRAEKEKVAFDRRTVSWSSFEVASKEGKRRSFEFSPRSGTLLYGAAVSLRELLKEAKLP